jgi:hypothetical protein
VPQWLAMTEVPTDAKDLPPADGCGEDMPYKWSARVLCSVRKLFPLYVEQLDGAPHILDKQTVYRYT